MVSVQHYILTLEKLICRRFSSFGFDESTVADTIIDPRGWMVLNTIIKAHILAI